MVKLQEKEYTFSASYELHFFLPCQQWNIFCGEEKIKMSSLKFYKGGKKISPVL